MLKWLKNFFIDPILNFVYPPVCFLCNQLIEDAKFCVCIKCWSEFKKVEKSSIEFQLLMERFKNDGIIDKFCSLYIFEKDGKFQETIHLLKYKKIKSIGITFGRELGVKIENELGKFDFLTAVPLHKLKFRERGYNQVDYICRGISEVSGIEFKNDLIIRTRYTKTQTELTFLERKENVKDAFSVNRKYFELLKDAVVVVVDDVITTGSTVASAGQVLKEAGCKTIYAASVGLASI